MDRFTKSITIYGTDLGGMLVVFKLPDSTYSSGQYIVKLFNEQNKSELPGHLSTYVDNIFEKTGRLVQTEEVEFRKGVTDDMKKLIEKSIYHEVGV